MIYSSLYGLKMADHGLKAVILALCITLPYFPTIVEVS